MSQRPAAVDKDYITQCDWLVWHRLTWENDTAVAERILGDDAAETVRSLADGEALVMTDWDESVERVQFRRKRTLDAGGTPDLDALETDSSGRRRLVAEYSDGDPADLPAVPDDESESTEDGPDAALSDEERSSEPETDRSSTANPTNADRSRTVDRTGSAASSTPVGADEYDPIWEVGYAFVHLYEVLAAKHRRALDRLEGVIGRKLGGNAREPAVEADLETGGRVAGADVSGARRERGGAGRGSVDSVARYLSRLVVVALYVTAGATILWLL